MWLVESGDGYEWYEEGLFGTEVGARGLASAMLSWLGWDEDDVRVRQVTAEEAAKLVYLND